MIKNKEQDKKKLVRLVDCIANNNDLDEFLKAEGLNHFKRHVIEVEKLFRSGLFLKVEIPQMLGLDYDELISFNSKLKQTNVMSGDLLQIDIIH